MRNRFDPDYELGIKPIEETPVLAKCRDETPALVAALLEIYRTPRFNERIYSLLEEKIIKGKERTGRKGLNLWQIFVLAEFRLTLNLDYDKLHYMANSDSTLRHLLGIETETGFERIEIGYQRILDNVRLLDDATLRAINEIIIEFGHGVFKKKEGEALHVKTDTYAVETNVHFPTDYNLLLDSSRKAIKTVKKFTVKYPEIEGWRKLDDWFRSLKNLSRALGKASSSGGKNKVEREKQAARKYLTKATAFRTKLASSKGDLIIEDPQDVIHMIELEYFMSLVDKHIDLVERRIIKGEKIPHEEKLFSIFEQYTEWITKGKMRPNVELGKKLAITTDQYGLIIDYYILENESDPDVVVPIADRVLFKHNVFSWSFDKGFWNKENKLLLQLEIEKVIMPKKGKRNSAETQEEHTASFKRLRNQHSAVESNINELEHHGLDRCPDKGYRGFKRYIAMGVIAYNLHRIGKQLIKIELEKQQKNQKVKFKRAA